MKALRKSPPGLSQWVSPLCSCVTRPISRVLSWTVIYLGRTLPSAHATPSERAGLAECSSTVLFSDSLQGPRGLPTGR